METIARNLDTLLAFHAVAVARGFSQAADDLGASKAMLSKQVKRLEAQLGTNLFHRTTRRVSLTESGEALFAFSQKIFAISDEAAKRLADLSQGSSGLVRISAPVSLGEAFVAPVLAELRGALPDVRFEIDLSNVTRDFAKDRIDFAIRATDEPAPDLIARHLGRIRDVVCVSPSYLARLKMESERLKHPRDLTETPRLECIGHSLRTAWNTWTFTKGDRDQKVEVRGNVSTNQYSMMLELCLQGFGIARLPYYMAAASFKSGELIRLFADYEISTHPLYLVYLRNEYAAKKHKITRDVILKWFRNNPEFFAR